MEIKRDWRNAEDYDFTEDLNLEGWAWEFLRRNDEYISEWEKLSNFYLRLKVAKREDFDDPKFRIKLQGYSQKWGLKYGFLNPEQDNPSYLDFTKTRASLEVTLKLKPEDTIGTRLSRQIRKILNGEIGHNIFSAKTIFRKGKFNFPINFYYDEDDVLAFFDLKLPIKPQVKKVSEILTKVRKQKIEKGEIRKLNPKLYKDNWINCLRVFDAKKKGTKPIEIAKVIFPNVKNKDPEYSGSHKVRDHFKLSKKLINGGYRKLVIYEI